MPRLLVHQKNDLFQEVSKNAFSHSDFEWVEVSEDEGANTTPVLSYKANREFMFSIGSESDGHGQKLFVVHYSPGSEHASQKLLARAWDAVVETAFDGWLKNIRRETETADLWETVASDKQLIEDVGRQPEDNQPFTSDEQLQVKKALSEIKAYLIKTHNLSGTRLEAIEGRLSYLEESAARMGRKDWLHISIGVLANIATSIALGGNDTRELFQFAWQVFKQFLGSILYLAGPH
jgi:hypothetical protein